MHNKFTHFFVVLTLLFPVFAFAKEPKPTILQVTERTMTVNGKPSKVFHIAQPNGTFGYVGKKGELFNVIVENKTHTPLVLHWHGVIDPNDQDGVPYVTQLPIEPGKNYHYQFTLKQAGTFWFHSHYQLQEQKLMAAPLIIHDPSDEKQKEALLFIQDFSFTDPNEIYAKLRGKLQKKAKMEQGEENNMDHANMDHSNMNMNMSNHKMTDVSDVKFDAYLTNHKTLRDPDVVRVNPEEVVRLRIINASASSNYTIDLGKLKGTLLAVDAEPVRPIQSSNFQIGIGNRLDIEVTIPEGEGVYPILALPEGTRQQTGLILATRGAKIPTFSEKTKKSNPLLDYTQELKLAPVHALKPHPIQQTLPYTLQGDMQSYNWTINGQLWPHVTPYKVKPGERIEMVFTNKSGMSHPMHFHGHTFQITEIDGTKINGRKGDTVNIMPNSTVKVALDTDNPGIWMLHCHILYHQMGGMMTTVDYEGYPNKFTMKEQMEGEKLYGTSMH